MDTSFLNVLFNKRTVSLKEYRLSARPSPLTYISTLWMPISKTLLSNNVTYILLKCKMQDFEDIFICGVLD